MKAREILHGLAVVTQSLATVSPDPSTRAEAGAAAALIALLERILEGRTPEQAAKILKNLLANGVKPITHEELDAQAKAIVAALEHNRDS